MSFGGDTSAVADELRLISEHGLSYIEPALVDPAPGWTQHRMPLPGLYQTGDTTHPGGSVTGGPGGNAAIGMLTDLGHDPNDVMHSGRLRAPAGAAGNTVNTGS